MTMKLASRLILCFVFTVFSTSTAFAKTECFGDLKASHHVIYLHGFEDPKQRSPEEDENRRILERLAREKNLRIALPQAPTCPNGKKCWSGKNEQDIKETFRLIQKEASPCWSTASAPYSLVGFSNGGYFALKLYRQHQDPRLKKLLAFGSAGYWDPAKDQRNPYSSFSLFMGERDITLKEAQRLAQKMSKTGMQLKLFKGGHRLDYDRLAESLP